MGDVKKDLEALRLRRKLRPLERLEYQDPGPLLVHWGNLERAPELQNAPDEIKKWWRGNPLKKWRERRDACIFCYGLGIQTGRGIWVNDLEAQDYDFTGWWGDRVRRTVHFMPVQLKEVVPHWRNPDSSLQEAIDGFAEQYVDSADLTIAIYVNQRMTGLDLVNLVIPPKLKIAGLWLFGAIADTERSMWCLQGNLMRPRASVAFTIFRYPTRLEELPPNPYEQPLGPGARPKMCIGPPG